MDGGAGDRRVTLVLSATILRLANVSVNVEMHTAFAANTIVQNINLFASKSESTVNFKDDHGTEFADEV